MSADLSTAFSLLGVGMITVFLVLSFVVIIGNLLISTVNRFVPVTVIPDVRDKTKETLDPGKVEAIKKAIDKLTDGKAEVLNIEKS